MREEIVIHKKKPRASQKRKEWYSQLLTIAKQRGYALGWVSAAFHQKFGVWPPEDDLIDSAEHESYA